MQANLVVEINSEDIPPGPAGKNYYELWLEAGNTGTLSEFLEWSRSGLQSTSGIVKKIEFCSMPPGANTASLTYVSTGLTCSISANAGEQVLIDVSGMVNHTAQNIIHFTLKRNGVDLTPAGYTGLACVRIDMADGVRALSMKYKDSPPAGPTTYELFWRCHNAGTAYLGRRPVDLAMMVPTTMSLTVF